MNILTFDIEEWFHLLNYKYSKNETDWNRYPERINANVDYILETIQRYDQKATFFILGWIAEKYPDIVKKIASLGYEIGCHTGFHQLVNRMSPESFRSDLSRTVKILEDVSGQKITLFRAPGFSIKPENTWAFEILAECGISTDCSFFPSGFPGTGLLYKMGSQPLVLRYGSNTIKELPVSSSGILGYRAVFSGGGYFRVCSYSLIRHWTNRSSYVMTYFHPRDFDSEQPMLEGLPAIRKFRSYTGLKSSRNKFERWLSEFRFVDIATADSMIDWKNVKTIHL